MRDLVACERCQRHIDTTATACPFCAADRAPSSAVRRAVSSVTRAAVFASVAACGSNKPAAQTIEAPPPPGDAAVVADAPADAPPPDASRPDAPATMSSLRGRVTEGTSPGGYLSLRLVGRQTSLATTTDPDGHYVFDKVPAGRYVLEIEPRRPMEDTEERAVTVTDAPTTFDIKLPKREYSNSAKPYGAPPARRRIV